MKSVYGENFTDYHSSAQQDLSIFVKMQAENIDFLSIYEINW